MTLRGVAAGAGSNNKESRGAFRACTQYTLRFHRWSREIAGSRAAALPG